MELQLKTLTPLWTGGVETGKMERIHETGIIGSLRWWYEAIVRGLGADVCNPTSDNPADRCQFDAKAYEKTKRIEDGLADVCPVCRLFGCTGWKRRFELSAVVKPNQLHSFWLATLDQPKKFNNWWLSQVFKIGDSKLFFGNLPLYARFIRGYEHHEEVVKALLSLMANYGAIGSRVQYGFGQFAYTDAYAIEKSFDILRQQIVKPTNPKNLSDNFYTLHDFWCLQCLIPNNDQQIKKFQQAKVVGDKSVFDKYQSIYLPVSFDIRYKLPGSEDSKDKGLRQNYRLNHGKYQAREVFGTVQGEEQKWGSRIFVSHLYKSNDTDNYYQLRVWGFTDSAIHPEIQSALEDIFPSINVTATTGQKILDMADKAS